MKKIIFILAVFVSVFSGRIYSQDKTSGAEDLKDIYTIVDKKPYLEGFKRNVEKYFQKYMKYPEDAYISRNEGTVYVSFVVTKTGEVGDVYISRSTDNIFNNEALRLVETTSGHWKPGKVDGEAVNTRMVLPVRFQLSEQDHETIELLSSFDEAGGKPLFVLDNKIVNGVVELEDYNVRSVRVIKGEKAVKYYGPDAKYGVVIITTKNGTPPFYKLK